MDSLSGKTIRRSDQARLTTRQRTTIDYELDTGAVIDIGYPDDQYGQGRNDEPCDQRRLCHRPV